MRIYRCMFVLLCLYSVDMTPCYAVKSAVEASVERIALLVWHDRGWKGRRGHPGDQRLRYAKRDAELLASVLKTKGNFQTRVLAKPTSQQLWKQLQRIRARSKRPGKPIHFLFYYSGHADERFLRLGASSQPQKHRFSLKQLASFLKTIKATVKIGILDACNSGSLIDLLHARTKGRGKGFAPYFKVPPTLSQGMAILTSASPAGKARELDRLHASLFTHYLVRGLWGKADRDRDGKVTSIEAYEYARLMVERELPGRQQPMFLNHFRGQEAYPITLSYNAQLVLPQQDGERWSIVGRRSVWKVRGKTGLPRVVSLMAGRYKIFLRDPKGQCFHQDVTVRKAHKTWLSARHWKDIACHVGKAKGEEVATVPSHEHVVRRLSLPHRGEVSLGFDVGALTASLFRPWLGGTFGFSLDNWRIYMTFLGESFPQYFTGFAEISVSWGWQLQRSSWKLHLGGLLGVGLLMVFHEQALRSGQSPSLRYGVHAEFGVRLTWRLWLFLRGFGGMAHTVVKASREGGTFLNAWTAKGTVAIGYQF